MERLWIYGSQFYPIQVISLYLPINLSVLGNYWASLWWRIQGWITHRYGMACTSLKQWERHRLTSDALVYEALFTWQLSPRGHHLQNWHHNWCPGVSPSDTPPSSQATGQEMRSLPKKADKLPASECQKTKHSLSNICVHCEEIYKKKGSHADIPGSISLKVIPFAAMKGSPDAL